MQAKMWLDSLKAAVKDRRQEALKSDDAVSVRLATCCLLAWLEGVGLIPRGFNSFSRGPGADGPGESAELSLAGHRGQYLGHIHA